MKKLLPIMLCILIVITSCQVESDSIEDSINTAELELSISKEQDSSSNSNLRNPNIPSTSNSEELHRNMQWIAYIAFETLMTNDARHDFANRIGLEETILLDDLIGDDIPNESPFKRTFIEALLEYAINPTGNPCPNQDPPCTPQPSGSKPPPPLGNLDDTPGISGDNPLPSLILSIFDGILDFECIEIYLPFKEVSPFTPLTDGLSVAHPLQAGDEYNATAYIFGMPPSSICPLPCPPQANIFVISSSGSYPDFESIVVLMVRPTRNIRYDCLYEEYSTIDFTEFLN